MLVFRRAAFSYVFATIERSSCFSFCAKLSTEICMNVSCVSRRCRRCWCCCCDRRNSAHELHGSLRFSIYLFSQLNAGSVVERVRHAITTRQMCVHRSWVSTTKIDNRPKPTAETKPGPTKYERKKRTERTIQTAKLGDYFNKAEIHSNHHHCNGHRTHNGYVTTNWHRSDDIVSAMLTVHDTPGSWCRSTLNAYDCESERWYANKFRLSQMNKCKAADDRRPGPAVWKWEKDNMKRQRSKKKREREHVRHRKEMRNKIYKFPKASTENGLPNRNHINLIIVLPTALDNF